MSTIRAEPDRLVVRTRTPSHIRLILILVGLVVVAGLVMASYHYGSTQQEPELRRAETQLEALQGELAQLRGQYDEVRGSLEKARRQLQIDKAAYTELREQLHRANDQLAGLRNDLKFYRSIISPEDGQSGLRIQDFELQPTGVANQYRYRLVLIQALKHNRDVSARVSFLVEGDRDGTSEELTFPSSGADPVRVKFKYFQTVTGSIDLPEGFVPNSVTVSVKGPRRKDPSARRRYSWPAA